MLYEFLAENQEELAARCRAKVAERSSPQPTPDEMKFGIPLFIVQLVEALRAEQTQVPGAAPAEVPGSIGQDARKHGHELLRHGFTIDQVIHDYGDLCQAVTELAHAKEAPISVDEFHTFNRCLDGAMADAVAEFGRQRDQAISDEGTQTMNERLGFLAHELRNYLNSAMLAFEVIKGGNVTLTGATGAVLGRSLLGLRSLVDRSLADVRLTEGLQARRERIVLRELLEEAAIAASLDANARGLAFSMPSIDDGLVIEADRQMISSALANLLQNAFKFTRPRGHVSLSAHAAAERVVIEIQDECGGLPAGTTEELFQPFHQRGDDRTGLGLGLSISRRGVEANGGKVRVRDLPGHGCVFTIELPRIRSAEATEA